MSLRRTLCLLPLGLAACAGSVDEAAAKRADVHQSAQVDGLSLEVGLTPWGPDHALIDEAPADGVLFSVWTRIPDPGADYPWNRGNMDVFVLRGAGWHMRCLVGNSSANGPDEARYSANTMLFVDPGETWVGDYSYYESNFTLPEAPVRDWVWVAWHVVVDEDSFAIRQWLKYGADGAVFAAGESDVSFEDVRQALRDGGHTPPSDFQPSAPNAMQVGKDHGFLTHARVEQRRFVPTLDELEAIARGEAESASAWAAYPLVWQGSGPDLTDVSGHGRDLSLPPGGALESGPLGPSL